MKLAEHLRAGLDPVQLARVTGMEPDPWQAGVLRSRAPRLLMLCCRQAGKSSVSAVLAVHEAVYVPGSLVLLLSPSMRQSQELFRKCQAVYRALGKPVPADTETTMSLGLESGSRIVCLPGGEDTVRGFSAVRLLLVDEAARVADETYYSARPMVGVSGGRIILMSTPAGRRGFFFEHVQNPVGWEVARVPASECPRLTQAFLEEERAVMGDYVYRQEYELGFVDDATAIFPEELIAAAFRADVTPLWEGA